MTALVAFVTGAVLYTSYRLIRRNGHLLDPTIWFPVLLVIGMGSVVVFQSAFGTPAWYSRSVQLYEGNYYRYFILLGLSLVGFHVGVMLARTFPAVILAGQRTFTSSGNALSGSAELFTVIGVVALWTEVLMLGPSSWFHSYGENQFVYDGYYYLHQFAQLMFFPSFGLLVACQVAALGRVRTRTWFYALAFVGPLSAWGDRSALVYLFVLCAVPLYSRFQSLSHRRQVVFLLAAGATIFFVGLLGLRRVTAVEGVPAVVTRSVLGLGANTGALVLMVMEMFPDEHPFLYGSSLVAAIGNLVPGFLIEGQRPLVVPSLFFHQIFRPDVTNHGFGFALLAEGYINFGLLGGFVMGALLGGLLGRSYQSLRREPTPVRQALFAVIAFQSAWFIRGDSTVFVKSIIYAAVVIGSARVLATVLNRGRVHKDQGSGRRRARLASER